MDINLRSTEALDDYMREGAKMFNIRKNEEVEKEKERQNREEANWMNYYIGYIVNGEAKMVQQRFISEAHAREWAESHDISHPRIFTVITRDMRTAEKIVKQRMEASAGINTNWRNLSTDFGNANDEDF